jgi:MarR family transcriptional regulator, organic hydroperoxide resistance regulator
MQVDKTMNTMDYCIRSNWLKLARMYNYKAQEYGVSMSYGFILLNIDKDGTSSTQLGPKMGMEPTSLSRSLKSLLELGLIKKEGSSSDKRRVLLFLTKEGVKQRKIAKKVVVDFNTRLMSKFSENELSTYFKIMSVMNDFVEKELEG